MVNQAVEGHSENLVEDIVEDIVDQWARDLTAGRKLANFSLTEPRLGPDAAHMSTRARQRRWHLDDQRHKSLRARINAKSEGLVHQIRMYYDTATLEEEE